jgi:inositol transport system ATP-binding protein
MDWLLEAKNLSKSFSGIRVLDDITFNLRPGEVHALMGENGAGKSTLMKILAGLLKPSSGAVYLGGQRMVSGNPHAALKAGIAMIHQELLPFPNLTVAENILMGVEPARLLGWIDQREMHNRSAALLARLGVSLSTSQMMSELRVAELQVVEIAKALAHNARIIIMDEPTSALTEREAEALFSLIRDLRSRGVSMIYISHKFDEVFSLADRITVLRDGRHVCTGPVGAFTPETLIAQMVGREMGLSFVRSASEKGEVLLEVHRLGRRGHFQNVSFQVRRGEILGFAGLLGAGRTDVVCALGGLTPADAGEIVVAGTPKRIRRPADALRAGIGLVTEDRKMFGLVPTMNVKSNLTLAALSRCSAAGVVHPSRENRLAAETARSLGLRGGGLNTAVGILSGGNQQKVVLGRTLLTQPEVLLLDEPTRGIDVGAKAEVHAIIDRLAASGKAVVLVSSELPELMSLSDRILVMRQGRLTAELDPRTTTASEILKAAIPE